MMRHGSFLDHPTPDRCVFPFVRPLRIHPGTRAHVFDYEKTTSILEDADGPRPMHSCWKTTYLGQVGHIFMDLIFNNKELPSQLETGIYPN